MSFTRSITIFMKEHSWASMQLLNWNFQKVPKNRQIGQSFERFSSKQNSGVIENLSHVQGHRNLHQR